MRSEAAAPAAAALLMLALPVPQGATALVGWVHLCDGSGSIPLRLPLRRNGDAPAACHGAMTTAEKKKPRASA